MKAIRIASLIAFVFLGGCGAPEYPDWRDTLKQIRNEERGKIVPLPQLQADAVAPQVVPLVVRRDPFTRD